MGATWVKMLGKGYNHKKHNKSLNCKILGPSKCLGSQCCKVWIPIGRYYYIFIQYIKKCWYITASLVKKKMLMD